MKKIRFGKDIVILWQVLTGGEHTPLGCRDLKVEVRNGFGKLLVLPLYVSESSCVLKTVYHGKDHMGLGQHTLTLIENYGKCNQRIVDAPQAFVLVKNTQEESEEVRENTYDLNCGSIVVGDCASPASAIVELGDVWDEANTLPEQNEGNTIETIYGLRRIVNEAQVLEVPVAEDVIATKGDLVPLTKQVQQLMDKNFPLEFSVGLYDVSTTLVGSTVSNVAVTYTAKRLGAYLTRDEIASVMVRYTYEGRDYEEEGLIEDSADAVCVFVNKVSSFSSKVTFVVRITLTDGTVKEASVSLPFVYGSYFGVYADESDLNSGFISASGALLNTSKNYTKSGLTLEKEKFYYAYPKSYGALTSVMNGTTQSINAFSRKEMMIANRNGRSTTYYVYYTTMPVSVSGVTLVFS